MMTLQEIKSYLMEELKEERQKRIMGQESRYSYLFMICNDIGIVDETEEQKKRITPARPAANCCSWCKPSRPNGRALMGKTKIKSRRNRK